MNHDIINNKKNQIFCGTGSFVADEFSQSDGNESQGIEYQNSKYIETEMRKCHSDGHIILCCHGCEYGSHGCSYICSQCIGEYLSDSYQSCAGKRNDQGSCDRTALYDGGHQNPKEETRGIISEKVLVDYQFNFCHNQRTDIFNQ